MRRRTLIGSLAGFGLFSIWAAEAHAQQAVAAPGSPAIPTATATGFNVNRFEPAERGSDWFANESLDLRGGARLAAGAVLDYQHRPLAIYNQDDKPQSSIVLHQLNMHVGASLNLIDRIRIGVSIPIVAYTGGVDGVFNNTLYRGPAKDTTIGDLRIGADVSILGDYGDPFHLAAGLQGWIPTGDKDSYTSDGKVRLAPRVMVAGDVSAFVYSVRAGFEYRNRSETFGASPIGSQVFFAAAAGARVLDRHLVIGPEVFGSSTTDGGDFFGRQTTPLEVLLGAHGIFGDFRVGAGVGKGLTRGYGSPEVRGLFSLEYFPQYDKDTDGDGIFDSYDACPTVKGVKSDDPKLNGCPNDRDKDGIIDTEDACPDDPGKKTDDPQTNGCPDKDGDGVFDKVDACIDEPGIKTADPKTNGCPDKDGDGVMDKEDACPADPGVKTSDPKTNGCPDKDGDGVFDKDDACIDVPGVKTTDPKTNGCPPDPDRDKDGIPNDQDACPDEPGKPDKDPKRNGCPRAFVKGNQIKILDQVKFQTNSAKIVAGKDSEEILQAVLSVMKAHPEIKKIRVEGHTDNRGGAELNRKLSAARAASVVDWLVKHGLEKNSFTSQGFGPDQPIEPNTTDAGRAANRRVEFHIEGAPVAPEPDPAKP